MKEFSKKQIAVFVVVFTAVLIFSAAVSIILISTCLSNSRGEESAKLLMRSEYDSALSELMKSLEENDICLSYHYARTASEKAALIGENEASRMLFSAADRLISEDGSDESLTDSVKETLDGFFERKPEDQTEIYDDAAAEDSMLEAYRTEVTDMCVKRLFGEHNPLLAERKSVGGDIVYTCSNAYAVIDSRSGVPREAVISLERAEKRLDVKACAEYALRFIGDFFIDDISSSAKIASVTADDYAGTFVFDIHCRDRSIKAAVRRDNGRLAYFLIR